MNQSLLACLTLLCAVSTSLVPVSVAADNSPGTVYVIPVEGMIERGLVYVVRRGVRDAINTGAKAIIFNMDTPGGRLDATEEIMRIISRLDIPTVTYVNPQAISAGAIIALATDNIYMSPRSIIGDAMPIMMSPMGGAQEMPEAIQEKIVSAVSAMIRAAAQEKGHDPQLAEAMVRRSIEYSIGDKLISPEGELLTLTNIEAAELVERDGESVPLLSRGTIDSLDDLLQELNLADAIVKTLEVTTAEKIARYIELLSAVLLMGGLLGIYIEFRTPGFGLPGIAGIILLAIWFWGHNVAGLAGMSELLLLIAGLALLAIEIFVLPGFGITGAAGIICILAALMMGMYQSYPGGPWYPQPEQLHRMVHVTGTTVIGTFLLAMLLTKYLPKIPVMNRLVLASSLASQEGYTVSSSENTSLIGSIGDCLTDLRPSGTAMFGDRRLDVVTQGQYVEKGKPVRITECHGSRIVVEPLENI